MNGKRYLNQKRNLNVVLCNYINIMWWKYGLTFSGGVATGIYAGLYYVQQELQTKLDNFFSKKNK